MMAEIKKERIGKGTVKTTNLKTRLSSIARGDQSISQTVQNLSIFRPDDETNPNFKANLEMANGSGICHTWHLRAGNMGAAKARIKCMLKLMAEHTSREWKSAWVRPVGSA